MYTVNCIHINTSAIKHLQSIHINTSAMKHLQKDLMEYLDQYWSSSRYTNFVDCFGLISLSVRYREVDLLPDAPGAAWIAPQFYLLFVRVIASRAVTGTVVVLLFVLVHNFGFNCLVIFLAEVCGGHVRPTVGAGFCPPVLPWRRDSEHGFRGCFTQLFRRIGSLVRFSDVDLQTIAGFEHCITLVTFECLFLYQGLLIGFRISLIFLRSRCVFVGQKLLSASGIPFLGGRACPLPSSLGNGQGHCSSSGVQGEREGVANGKGKLEGLALVVQCLAEGQALVGQGGVIFTHSCHFCLLLN